MPIPRVTCGADQVLSYDASPRTISLTAVGTDSPTSYLWRILSYPAGSAIASGVKGDFVNGESTVQNPDVIIDGALDGAYVFQCTATNVVGTSKPTADKYRGQQVVIVKTKDLEYQLPGEYQYDWDQYLLATLRKMEQDILDAAGGVGYQPENFPVLEYNSASIIDCNARPGKSTTLRLKLSDDNNYTADVSVGPLQVDMATTGVGGREASTSDPETVSTWYYVYAVPSGVAGEFALVASVVPPGTGLTDFTEWRYLGFFWNNSVGDIERFYWQGPWFQIANQANWSDFGFYGFSGSNPTDDVWTQIDVETGGQIPSSDVVDFFRIGGAFDNDSGIASLYFQTWPTTPTWDPDTGYGGFVKPWQMLGGQDNENPVNERDFYNYDGTVWYRWGQSGTMDVSCVISAVRDKYVASALGN